MTPPPIRSPGTEVSLPIIGNPTHVPESCFKCNRIFRKGANPYSCIECGISSHRQFSCSGIKRGSTTNSWNCGNHRHAEQREDTVPSEDSGEEEDPPTPPLFTPPYISPRKARCTKCKGSIRINPLPVMCLEDDCGNRVHRKCSGLNQENLVKYFAGELQWSCDP